MGVSPLDMLEVMFDAGVRFGVLVLIAELVTRRHQRGSPEQVHRVWKLVACAGLLLPLIGVATPAVLFVQPSPVLYAGTAKPELTGFAGVLVLAYAAGVCVGLSRLVVGLVAIRRLLQRGTPLSEGEIRSAGIRFVESQHVGVPVTVGYRRPCIILPVSWRTWDQPRLTSVLIHEIAHIDRADYVAGLGVALLQAVWWWHPAAWLTGARLSLMAELACDARASVTLGPTQYASELLALATEAGARRLRYGWTVGATSRLTARIDALLAADDGSSSRANARFAFGVVLLALAGTCAAASVRFTPVSRSPAPSGLTTHAVEHDARHSLHHRGH